MIPHAPAGAQRPLIDAATVPSPVAWRPPVIVYFDDWPFLTWGEPCASDPTSSRRTRAGVVAPSRPLPPT